MESAKPRVVITGGSGKLGRAVVREFAEHGYAVVSVDRVRPAELPEGVQFVAAHTVDYGQAVELLTFVDDSYAWLPASPQFGVDALVHLAARTAGGILTNSATFSPTTSAMVEHV